MVHCIASTTVYAQLEVHYIAFTGKRVIANKSQYTISGVLKANEGPRSALRWCLSFKVTVSREIEGYF
jgi:hypothetical protein